MMDGEFICMVERVLVLHDRKTGKKGEIRIAVGQPYWTDFGVEAVCPVAIYGYCGRLADIRGIDPMSALLLGVNFLEKLLRDMSENFMIYWPSGEEYF